MTFSHTPPTFRQRFLNELAKVRTFPHFYRIFATNNFRMKKIQILLGISLMFLSNSLPLQASETSIPDNKGRDSILWNFDWKFQAGDIADAWQKDFDDSQWRLLDLPHDFQIEQDWVAPKANESADKSDDAANVKSELSARGFKAMGKGWYRKTFVPNEALKDKRWLLDFEGLMYVGDVYLNGEKIASCDYGYLGFDIDITSRLRWNEENVVAVMADTRAPKNSRWYTGGGLFRDVHLILTPQDLYLTRHPLKITTEVEGDKGIVYFQAEACNRLKKKPSTMHFVIDIYDADNQAIARQEVKPRFYSRQGTSEYDLDSIVIENVNLWDCENPYLYRAEISLLYPDGSIADKVGTHFGVRELSFSPEYGLKLNGKKVLLKGIANHHALGALGAAVYDEALEKRILLLKKFGFNHIRTSHNPYSQSLLDLCDRHGILVVDEIYDKWVDQFCGGRAPFMELWPKNIPEWIKRDRNHPCVVMWSLGNETQQYWNMPYSDWGVTLYKMMKVLVQRYDDSRLMTVAMHPRYRDVKTDSLPAPLVLVSDVASYNYRYMYFPGDSRRFPQMMFYQSEANTVGMGENWYAMDLDKVIGLAYWGGIDYLGESHGWPNIGWNMGVFDISLEPKPTAYYIKSYFQEDKPMVHIAVYEGNSSIHWNDVNLGSVHLSESWNRQAGEILQLYAFSNADEVEIRLNGKALARKSNQRDIPKMRNRFIFDNISYLPGKLEAWAYTNGKVVARHSLQSTNAAYSLRITDEDQNTWKANGMDIKHLRIEAVDRQGRRVPEVNDKVSLKIEGDAHILAVGNGNISNHELNTGNEISLHKGSCLVILKAGKEGGKIRLEAQSKDIRKALWVDELTP